MSKRNRKNQKNRGTNTATPAQLGTAIGIYTSSGLFRIMWEGRETDNCFFVILDLDHPETNEMARVCIHRSILQSTDPAYNDQDNLAVGFLGGCPDGVVNALEANTAFFRANNCRPFLLIRMPDSWIWKWASDPNARGETAPRDVIADFDLRPKAVPVLGMTGCITMETVVTIN